MPDELTITKQQANGTAPAKLPDIMFIGFADNRIPEVKEVKSKEWILFGEDNRFPDHLLYLYNKSANHNSIINNKVTYIIGDGLPLTDRLKKVNRYGESINKVLHKFCTDVELFGGAYLEIIYDALGRVTDVCHLPFQAIRVGKDGGYYYCKQWDWVKYKRVQPVYMAAYNPDPKTHTGSQVFCYKEYRAGCDIYPLPGYFGALNDIETDTEISIYNLSVMKNGQFSGKLISFFNGIPEEEAKRVLEKKWNNKFNGSGNAGKTMIAFNNGSDKEPAVTDLSTTDLDKLFDQLSKSIQQKMFSGHQITSPTIFGIMEPGKLGGKQEMQDSFEIFKNTYANQKQVALEEVCDFVLPLFNEPVGQKFIPVRPIGITIDPAFVDKVPIEWLYEQLGIDITKYPPPATAAVPAAPAAMVNDNIKNLTGRQHQQLLRIIKQYGQGKLSRTVASTMLKTGLGLGDQDIETMLGSEQFSSADPIYTEEEVADMFAACGTGRASFEIVMRKRFDAADTDTPMTFADVKGNDSAIVDLIRKDKRITAKIIAETLGVETGYVTGRIKVLQERGVLQTATSIVGIDTIVEHTVNPSAIDTIEKPETVNVFIRYSYEVRPGVGPELIDTSRPFCRKMIALDRLYTRAEIEIISQRVGFSVWDREGGWWGNKPHCRHEWYRLLLIRKNS